MKFNFDKLPKRIILSRKGWDSTWGKKPSPIVDGKLISLPIPEHLDSECCYTRSYPEHIKFRDLGASEVDDFVGEFRDRCVHLDPDIRPHLRKAGASRDGFFFGQGGSAQRHLNNQDVCKGDLFLFFGWFKGLSAKTTKPEIRDQHAIWGWLEIGEKYDVLSQSDAKRLHFASHHPHVTHWMDEKGNPKTNNTLYSAPDRLSMCPKFKGAGIFDHSQSTELTRKGESRSRWEMPSFVKKAGMTYHTKRIPKNLAIKDGKIHFESAPIGQEFVTPGSQRPFETAEKLEVGEWLKDLFKSAQE
jgi:Nucleotide modification associated domain 3